MDMAADRMDMAAEETRRLGPHSVGASGASGAGRRKCSVIDPTAGSDHRLAHRRRNADADLINSTRNVAVACGIYGQGQLGQAREDNFKRLENEWPNLRQELLKEADLQGDRRSLLSVFMAVQLTRTLKHSNRDNFISNLAATTTERPITRDAVRQFLRKLDGAGPDDAEVKAAWTFVSVAPDAIPTRDEALKLSVGIAVKDIATAASSSSSRPKTPRRSSITLRGQNRRRGCDSASAMATQAVQVNTSERYCTSTRINGRNVLPPVRLTVTVGPQRTAVGPQEFSRQSRQLNGVKALTSMFLPAQDS